jgi:hypothetical protein
MAAKKTWKKPDQIISLGECRLCNKEITNDMKFLSFADQTRSHFDCDRKDYYKQLIEKNKNEKGLSQN